MLFLAARFVYRHKRIIIHEIRLTQLNAVVVIVVLPPSTVTLHMGATKHRIGRIGIQKYYNGRDSFNKVLYKSKLN